MASLFTPPYFDVGAGITPSDGALLNFYVVGSGTRKNVYTTAAATTAHANPVVADALGVFPAIYLSGDYDWVLTDKNAVQKNTGSVSEFATVANSVFIKNFATLALAVADTNLVDGDVLNLEERTTGNGGGGIWDVVLSSTVTENTYNIVQCTGVATLSLVLRESDHADLSRWGAVTGSDMAGPFQSAIDNSILNIFIPPSSGLYQITGVFINRACKVFGGGMGKTIILPTTLYSAITVASDNVELKDFEFRGQTGTGQAEIFGSCIEFDATANFVRHMEGCKIERIKFRNLKTNGILISHLLRESHIRECRFVGVGDAVTDASPIKMENSKGTPSNINNLWIVDNMFYRFNNPAILCLRSTLLAGTAGSFADLRIRGNLIHGQLMDESGGVVEPELTDTVKIQDLISGYFTENNFTSSHPLRDALRITNNGTFGKVATISNNHFAVKGLVDGVTYTRAGPDFATGHFIEIIGSETINISSNELFSGTYVTDMLLTNGDYTTTLEVEVVNTTSQAGDTVIDYAGLGSVSTGWTGTIEQSTSLISTRDNSLYGTQTLTAGDLQLSTNALSTLTRDSSASALRINYNVGTSGVILGSPGANQFQVATNGGTSLLVVDTTTATRPGVDNSYALGTASFRWTQVFAVAGAINTSDEREKTDWLSLGANEKAAALEIKASIKKYKWIASKDKKGDLARWHIGTGAQTVKYIMESHGLAAEDYGFLCYDEWDDIYEDVLDDDLNVTGREVSTPAGNKYGLRYDELIMFILASI